ncbi:MAG: TIGR03960 family B12-binding radical SAM protein [Dehalococcoidales bacterium]|nr:TIGR03960 family B12-binding radical SAM protein [Dehalococcoidales bacterium]
MPYPDNLLSQVTKPARYTGGEWNSAVKDWAATPIRIALSYPDVYEIGMSNIALPVLYDLLNRQPDVLAERVFAPWVDMATAMSAAVIPLLSLESQHPLKDFDIIGFSLGYELTYTNVLNMLHLAQVPVLATERNDAHPVIIAGGSGALNPEPMADFIDLFVVGDGEEVLLELLDCFRDRKERGKNELLRRAAAIPSIYVPSLYRVTYDADGLFRSITPAVPEASPRIPRRMVTSLPPSITCPVVPFIEVVHDRGAIEIQRGCSRGCRFCQAGFTYRPVRERPKEEVVRAAGELVANCGYDEVSLVSLSTCDYTGIDQLVTELAQHYPNLALSLPSLRIDNSSVKLMGSLPARSRTGLTFAPEAGSDRLRQTINKNVPEDVLLETVTTAFAQGWHALKLYFMVGLPTETFDDVEGIVQLVEKVRAAGRQASGKTPQLRISVATFIPKPHTSFQRVAQENEASLNAKHEILRAGLRQKGVRLSWSNPKLSLLEAVLSRGDRRLGKVIHRAWQLGSTFDAWDEHFNYENWRRAFTESGLKPDFYARRERPPDEPLPWSHIDTGISADFLKREYRRAMENTETPDCRHNPCQACGLEGRHLVCRQKLGG